MEIKVDGYQLHVVSEKFPCPPFIIVRLHSPFFKHEFAVSCLQRLDEAPHTPSLCHLLMNGGITPAENHHVHGIP